MPPFRRHGQLRNGCIRSSPQCFPGTWAGEAFDWLRGCGIVGGDGLDADRIAAEQDPATAFFIVPALRAVTEDLILFRFLDKTGTQEERDIVIGNLMLVDVLEKID